MEKIGQNPPWSTLLFRKLIQNPEFRQRFWHRASADYMDGIFRPEILLSQIDAKAAAIASEIDTTLSRWDQNPADWEWNIEQMRSFSRKRQPYFRSHIMQELGVSDTLNIVLSSNLRDAGSVQVNAITVSKFPWLGQYFKSVSDSPGWTGIEPADSAHVVADEPRHARRRQF
ncbi:MAG: CotH kinase family protein [Calditrichia bacterium]